MIPSTITTLLCLVFIPFHSFNDVVITRVRYRTTPLDFLRNFEWPLEMVAGSTLSLEASATPKHFRLVDCRAYLNEHILNVIELHSLDFIETIPYAAVSYVWRGNHQSPASESFAVEGATNSDRIDLEVLRVTCATAGQKGADYLWIDQLCIMQTNVEDKNWQIQKMATIYRHSTVCLVLPGGLGGLVGEGETTSWVYRSWTLQEALLPTHTYCVIKWTRGPGKMSGVIVELDQKYALLPIEWLLQWMLPDYSPGPIFESLFHDKIRGQLRERISLSHLFGENIVGPLALSSALTKTRRRFWGDNEIESKDERLRGWVQEYDDAIESAIWRSITMRTSTRDIDVVFSAMGLFGVELDPSRYKTRLEALITFLQKSLEYGNRVSWLAAAVESPGTLPPLKSRAALDDILHPRVPDDAIWVYRVDLSTVDWYLANPPKGLLDNTGTLTVVAPLSPIDIDKSYDLWEADKTVIGATMFTNDMYRLSGRVGTHAVGLGRVVLSSTFHHGCEYMHFPNSTTLVMLLKPLDGKWYKVGMAVRPFGTTGWEEREVVILGDTTGRLYSSDLA